LAILDRKRQLFGPSLHLIILNEVIDLSNIFTNFSTKFAEKVRGLLLEKEI